MVSFDARTGKWIALALLVSLAGNAFMGGVLVGRWANPEIAATPVVTVSEPSQPASDAAAPAVGFAERAGPAQPAEAPFAIQMRRMIATLPQQYRPSFIEPFQQRRREIGAANFAVRDARLRLRESLTAERSDRARIEAAFAELRQRNAALQALLHTATVDGAMRLPPDVRRQLADWQSQPAQRQRGPGFEGPRPDRPPSGPGPRQ